MTPTDDDIQVLLQRLHYQAREHSPYNGLPLSGENNAAAAEELRQVVRSWIGALTADER